jgi:hypothetical protein
MSCDVDDATATTTMVSSTLHTSTCPESHFTLHTSHVTYPHTALYPSLLRISLSTPLHLPGTCQCNDITPLVLICNATCRASAPTMTCTEGGLSITQGGVTRVVPRDVATVGVLTCGTGGSNTVHSMSSTTGDFRYGSWILDHVF